LNYTLFIYSFEYYILHSTNTEICYGADIFDMDKKSRIESFSSYFIGGIIFSNILSNDCLRQDGNENEDDCHIGQVGFQEVLQISRLFGNYGKKSRKVHSQLL
jgi:hypothetical protein